MIDVVNAEQPDLVVLTGDLVDHWPRTVHKLTSQWLSQLRTKQAALSGNTSDGILVSLGNHDYQKPESVRNVISALRAGGFQLLHNDASSPLRSPQQTPWLRVVGIGDFWTDAYAPEAVLGQPDVPRTPTRLEANRRTWHYAQEAPTPSHTALLPVPPKFSGDSPYSVATVVLSHNPDTVTDLQRWPAVDLVLAGA